jgi:dienelactone hydrolase
LRSSASWIGILSACLVLGCGGEGAAPDGGADGPAPDATDAGDDGDFGPDDGGIEPGDGDSGPDDGGIEPGDGDSGPGDGDSGPDDGDAQPDDGDAQPDDGDAGPGDGDTDPVTSCRRATACGPGQTCNLSSGQCEPQATEPGQVAVILTAYPLAGAPGDFLMVEGQGFYSTLLPDYTARLTIGQASFNVWTMGFDENRMMVTRTAQTVGAMEYTGRTGAAQHAGPVDTDPAYAQPQPCGLDDPPASGAPGAAAAEAGPFAPGFSDLGSPWELRVHYPATCGGLRRPVAQGTFPVVLVLHGDGCIGINYDYLARHLASWGFLVVTPVSADPDRLRDILTAALDDPARLWAPLAGASAAGQAVVVGHSMGSTRAGDMLARGETRIGAVVFLGPVSQTIHDPVPGVVFGATGDMQSTASTYQAVFQALQRPRWLAVIQGGNHSQFTDAKHWEGWAFSDLVPELERNRQFELVQSLSLAFLQRHFGQVERFGQWLSDPGLPDELSLTVELP